MSNGIGGQVSQSTHSPQRKAIVVYHDDWGGAAPHVRSELQSRGYSVSYTGDAAEGLAALHQASDSLHSGDYLVVYLAGHGSNPRQSGDTSRATALEHFVQFNSGTLKVQQVGPLFEQAARRGVHLTVIDGSCNGGETVLNAMGQPYCALSTTGVSSPSLTNFPDPAKAMHLDSAPGEFGFWWDAPHLTASWLNGDILSQVPERVNQRLFRNDDTDFANLSLFLRPSIGQLTSLDLGGWNLHYQYCYLYRYIYPADYAALPPAEQNQFTHGLATYLATLHTGVDAAAPLFAKLGSYLNNHALLSEGAKAYAARYALVWQTLANDPTWDVHGLPGKHASQMKDLTPDAYKGEPGFLKIAAEIDYLMAVLRAGFDRQEALLREIDRTVREVFKAHPLPDPTRRVQPRAWPPAPGQPTLEFNRFERALIEHVASLDRQLKIDRSRLLEPAHREFNATPYKRSVEMREVAARRSIERGIEAYEGSFRTVLEASIGSMGSMGSMGSSGSSGSSGPPAQNAFQRQNLEHLIAKFKSISPLLYRSEGRISFLLAIVEDAFDKVQSGGTLPRQVPF